MNSATMRMAPVSSGLNARFSVVRLCEPEYGSLSAAKLAGLRQDGFHLGRADVRATPPQVVQEEAVWLKRRRMLKEAVERGVVDRKDLGCEEGRRGLETRF